MPSVNVSATSAHSSAARAERAGWRCRRCSPCAARGCTRDRTRRPVGNPSPCIGWRAPATAPPRSSRVDYAQVKPKAPGEVDFQHYHTYDEIDGAAAQLGGNSTRTSSSCIRSASRSKGREIWQITITNKKTGQHTDKPGVLHRRRPARRRDQRHRGDAVLHQPRPDAATARIRRSRGWWTPRPSTRKPNNNPDGASLYHYTAQTLRSTVRPIDNDGDGLLDEDAGEDLDGDGFVRQMRKFVGAGKGTAIVDPTGPEGPRDAPRRRRTRATTSCTPKGSTTTATAATTRTASAASTCTATTRRTGAR